jgi:hypothetical protein
MGALTKFDISCNDISVEGTTLLAEALRGNQVMTELSISSNRITDRAGFCNSNNMSGLAALADVIPGMGAISYLDISNNNIGQLFPQKDGQRKRQLRRRRMLPMEAIYGMSTLMAGSRMKTQAQSQKVLSPLPMPSPIWGR